MTQKATSKMAISSNINNTRPLAIKVEEAGRLLGISRSVAYEAVRCGEIQSVKIGGRILIPVKPLEEQFGVKFGGGESGSVDPNEVQRKLIEARIEELQNILAGLENNANQNRTNLTRKRARG